MSGHRWQGYRHEELYEQIHQGPGPDASTGSVRRWAELTRALGDIDGGLAAALNSAMSGWEGAAADSARGGLRPLGDWAAQAQAAAEVMRDRAEQQAAFVAKARADMPQPVRVTSEDPGSAISGLVHLFGGQTDYEVEEARREAAEQRAFAVMQTYESSTEANTTTLASFDPPPQVVVDGSGGGSGSGRAAGNGVTISWQSTPVAPAPIAATGRGTAGTAAGRADRSGNGSRSGAAGRTGGTRPTTGRSTRREDDQVDREVTERAAGSGGFFDADQTPSRPVIGGDPS